MAQIPVIELLESELRYRQPRAKATACETIALNKREGRNEKKAWWLPALAVLGYPVSCFAQTGTVTFYSYSPSLAQSIKTGLIPPGSRVSFTGWLFDGDKKIMHAAQGRFVTLRLTAGGHDLAAKYKASLRSQTFTLTLRMGITIACGSVQKF
jgi:hypothetical protein